MSFSAFDPTPDQPQMPPDEFPPIQDTRVQVEQLSLIGLLGALLRRPGPTMAGLQVAFSRQPDESTLPPLAESTADQVYWDTDDRDLARIRPTASRNTSAIGAFASNAARIGGNVLLPSGQSTEPVGSATANLSAILGNTSLAVLTVPAMPTAEDVTAAFSRSNLAALIGMVIGWLLAAAGVAYALRNGTDYTQLATDIFPLATLLIAGGIALFAVFGARLMPQVKTARDETVLARGSLDKWLVAHWPSVIIGGISLVLMGGAWAFNAANQFTIGGVICWVLSILGWWAAFDPALLRFRWLRRAFRWIFTLPSHLLMIRTSWSAVALIVILIVGAYMRLHELSAYPPDMTSDAVEMVLDVQRVADGSRPVFLPTNGGRESMEPYIYVAVLHNIFGVPIDYEGLKLLNGIEGIFNILAVYWLARVLFSDQDDKFGNLVALIAAGLVAVSYWDIVLSRMGERIVLTPIAVCAICVYFIRAVRYNRLRDYVFCGLAFGIGLYTYQAVRIIPVMFVICMLITLVMRVRSWWTLRRYVLYSLALVTIALAVFMPLARFAVDSPNDFWSRTYGRLLGQDNGVVTVKDPQTGQNITRPATVQDQIDAIKTNISYLGSNTLKSTLMFTWSGDRSWFTGTVDGQPELDALTGALFLLGVGLWIVRLVKRRDPGDWVVPVTIFAGLLATALALAFTGEVPSSTRGSGALPFAYILAAFAGALILRQIWRTFPGWAGTLLTGLVVILAWQTIGNANVDRYINDAMVGYRASTLPHNQAGQILKDFSTLYGAGNAFAISFPYWWDHRALAISASDLPWSKNNGIVRDDSGNPPTLTYQQNIVGAIRNNRGTPYEIRANHPMLFFINQNDQDVVNGLLAWLPTGSTVEHVASFNPDKDFIVLLSPPIDCTWLTLHVGPDASQDCATTPVTNPPTGGG